MNMIDFFEDALYKILEICSFSNFTFTKFANFAYFIYRRSSFNNANNLDSQNDSLNLIFTDEEIKPVKPLRDLQLLYLELFRFVDNVCKKYDIEYWLFAGSLLGAVRHGGFIPWDDDFDVQLTRESYNKLIEVLPIEIKRYGLLKENSSLIKLIGNENNYFTDFKSIYDVENINNVKGIRTKLLFFQFALLKPFAKIDFYPMDYLKEEKLEFFIKNQRWIKFKFNQDVLNGKVKLTDELEIVNKKLGLTNEKTDFLVMSVEAFKLGKSEVYNISDIFPLKEIDFENYKFKAPNNPDACLKYKYGSDYMDLPKTIENHNTLNFVKSQFNSQEEMDAEFEKVINYLKNINDNFE